MQLPFTRGMELEDWENAVSYVIGQYIPVPTQSSQDWQHWGLLFFQDPQLATLDPPNPFAFDDWHQWGDRLVESLSNADGVLLPNRPGTSPTAAFISTQDGFYLETQLSQPIVTQ